MASSRRIGERPSIAGLGLALLACAGLTTSCSGTPHPNEPWFGGYEYLTAGPRHELDDQRVRQGQTVLAFIVADEQDACAPSWGDGVSLTEASKAFSLEQQVAGMRHDGDDVVVSFGGAAGNELATKCPDVDRLQESYRTVLDRYQVGTMDFDIEMDDLGRADAHVRRAQAVADLQEERSEEDPLRVWLTLPVTPDGFEADALDVVDSMLEHGVDLTGVNLMTMSYGEGKAPDQSMIDATVAAAQAAHGQLRKSYQQAGVPLSDELVWNRMGLTPMIGQNDVPGEVFDLGDAELLNDFAREQGVGRISYWAHNRDRRCGPEWPERTIPTLLCSGVEQAEGEFARVLGKDFGG